MSNTYKSANIPDPNAPSGPGPSPSGNPPYVQNFVVATWSLNIDRYFITVNSSVHQRGNNVIVQVLESTSGNFEQVDVHVLVTPTGNVTISVGINSRFDGRVLIQGE